VLPHGGPGSEQGPAQLRRSLGAAQVQLRQPCPGPKPDVHIRSIRDYVSLIFIFGFDTLWLEKRCVPRGNTLLELCTTDIRISKISAVTDIKKKRPNFN